MLNNIKTAKEQGIIGQYLFIILKSVTYSKIGQFYVSGRSVHIKNRDQLVFVTFEKAKM